MGVMVHFIKAAMVSAVALSTLIAVAVVL